MAKPDWGTKRICQSCSAPFYDLRRDPILCPKCGATFDPEAVLRSRRTRSIEEEEVKEVSKEEETEEEVELETDEEIGEDADDILEDASDLGDDDMSDVIDTAEDKEDS